MKIGDRVRVIALGTFSDHTGKIIRMDKKFVWVVFDEHPWQRTGSSWSFRHREVVALQSKEISPKTPDKEN